MSFGGEFHTAAGTSEVDTDVFVAVYDGAGTSQYSESFGSAGRDQATIAAVDDGNLYVEGTFQDEIDFDGHALVRPDTADTGGGERVFVVKARADREAVTAIGGWLEHARGRVAGGISVGLPLRGEMDVCYHEAWPSSRWTTRGWRSRRTCARPAG